MGARTGAVYLEGLRDGREVWLDGVRVPDVTADPRLAAAARTIAGLYDHQHDADVRGRTLAPLPDGSMMGAAFMQPRSIADLVRRREAFTVWADRSGGMLGRSPDFLSAMLAAFASARDVFASADPRYGDHIQQCYESCRNRDLYLTHALSRPVSEQSSPIRVVAETSAGIVVTGSRALATCAPFADEILIFPGPMPRRLDQEGDESHAVAFCLPVATPGVRILCRESLTGGAASDHPLANRFDEQDAVVIFERVLVPWSRVFLYRNPALACSLWSDTRAFDHAMHQVLAKNLAKSEFVLGVAGLLADAGALDQHLHVQSMLGEIVDVVETLRAFIRAAEVDAVAGPGGTVVPNAEVIATARNYFPAFYPRLIDIMQIIGASGHIAHVPESTASSELAFIVDDHYATPRLGGRDRVRLLKLAADLACSGFAGRQVVYERYFDGDPYRKRARRYTGYPQHGKLRARAQQFLGDEAEAELIAGSLDREIPAR
jgi:4-hydroxyphenylacetate 3-monooxygenase